MGSCYCLMVNGTLEVCPIHTWQSLQMLANIGTAIWMALALEGLDRASTWLPPYYRAQVRMRMDHLRGAP